MPTDIKLDPLTHDIDLSSGTVKLFENNLVVVAQRVKIAILSKQGEWFRDIRDGVPYYQQIFTRKNNKPFIDQFMISYIGDVEDVAKVVSYSSAIDIETRVLNIQVAVQTYDGQIIDINVGGTT